MFVSFLTQESYLLAHSGWIARVRVLNVLSVGKLKRIWILAEPKEEESKRRMIKESFLCLLAVLIHRLTDDSKRYEWILQIRIVLIVSVREHKQLKELQEFKLSLTWWHAFDEAWEVLLREFKQECFDVAVFLLAFPFLEERLECGFEIECHCSETGAFEVEVEVHVIFLLRISLDLVSCSHGLDHLGFDWNRVSLLCSRLTCLLLSRVPRTLR